MKNESGIVMVLGPTTIIAKIVSIVDDTKSLAPAFDVRTRQALVALTNILLQPKLYLNIFMFRKAVKTRQVLLICCL